MRTLITALLALIVSTSAAHAETGTSAPQGGVVIILPIPVPTGG